MNVEKNPNPSKDATQAHAAVRAATAPLLVSFIAGDVGPWHIDRITPVAGESLATASRLDVIEGNSTTHQLTAVWALRGATSNTRYTMRAELDQLLARQEGLGRASSTRAALIPMNRTGFPGGHLV
jgi:hypothetical protein